ncbi:MAG: CPBP family intramembrane metalloprotease [Prevotellaceae bacterium]|jgi:hypothetical protein|nr:CPBP family intramembrane metalloprotease [Prevotellaceae bacterium]
MKTKIRFLKEIYLKFHIKPLWFSLLVFVLLVRLAPVILLVFYGLIYGFTDEQPLSYDYSDSIFVDIIFGGIIAPIIETLLCQTFLIWLFHKVCKFNYFTTVFLSGFLFGLLHAIHSVPYALCAGMAGFIFAFGYVFYTKKYNYVWAFWLIAGIHSFNNISVLIIHWIPLFLL